MNVQNELRYLLAVDLLDKLAADGFLTDNELAKAKRLAVEKYRPCGVGYSHRSVIWLRCQKR